MGPQLAVSPLTTTCSTMAGVCCGPTIVGDGCMRHGTLSAAASAVEMETRCLSNEGTLSGDLVVRVRDVVPGGLELTLTISDAIGDTPEVSRANYMRDANHDVPEEMSSDTNFGVLAGPICEICDDDWIDHGDGRPAAAEESGDVREVSTDITSVLDHVGRTKGCLLTP